MSSLPQCRGLLRFATIDINLVRARLIHGASSASTWRRTYRCSSRIAYPCGRSVARDCGAGYAEAVCNPNCDHA